MRYRGAIPRPRTIVTAREIRRLLVDGRLDDEMDLPARPRTRGECLPGGANEERPCPFVTCRYNLALDVNQHTGSIKLTFPDREIGDAPATCALDVADEHSDYGMELARIGELMNLTRERVRQLEFRGLRKLAGIMPEGLEGDSDV